MAGSRSSSIGRRLAGTVFLTSGVALALACVVLVLYDGIFLRRATLREVFTLADVIGLNSADALRFSDPEAARLTLSSLAAAPEVLQAAVFDAEGVPFARYVAKANEDTALPAPETTGQVHRFASLHLDVYQDLRVAGERIGTIGVRWDTRPLLWRLQGYLVLVALLLLVVYGLSRWIARVLRGRVADPLSDLARSAQGIAEGRLGTHVAVRGDDEIGLVANSFNAMAAGLRDLVARVRENMEAVSEVASALREDSGRMTSDAARQEGAVGEASSSISQVTDSVREVSESVRRLADRARDTSGSIVQMDASISGVATRMDRLAESAEGASSGTLEMAANVREIVAAMESLEGATDETAALLQQLAESVRRVEGNARVSGDLSREASDEASRGMEAVEETILSMREIRSSFERIQGNVRGLAQQSEAIGEILGVIESVVTQTNLLALNAAIIASQAGEHGKAFSVVAEQVKTLAERTSRSTREIAALIQGVQNETTATVDAVEAGSGKVAQGVQRSGEAGEVLKAIMAKSDQTARRVSEIVEATSRQAGDIRDVESAMSRVRALVDQTNHSTHEQEKVGSEIAQVVERIWQLGQEVKSSTSEQRGQSRRITGAVEAVAAGVDQIREATQAQAGESERIHQALRVFREVATESARRGDAFHRMVKTLAERSRRLEEAIDRFET